MIFLVRCFIIMAFTVAIGGCGSRNSNHPVAAKGVMDLRHWNFQKDGAVKLKGEWELYWQEFYSYLDFQKNPLEHSGYLMSPGIWRHQKIAGRSLPRHGYGTLRLQILLPDNHENLQLEIKDIRTAYELEVNGELVAQCGVIGTSASESKPQFVVKRTLIPADTAVLDVVVRLSEFHRDSGGIPVPIVLGTSNQILSRVRNFIIEEWLLIGFLLFSAIYHFGLFFLRSREIANLYFGLFCVNFILRLLSRGEKILFEITPMSWWYVMNKLELMILYLIPILYLVYYNELFKGRIKKSVYRFILSYFCLFLVYVLISPSGYISSSLLAFQVSGLVATIYVMWVTFRAYIERVAHSGVFLIGFAVLIAGIVNDIMYFNFIYRTMEVFNYSCIVFIFIQAYELASKSVKAFNREEELTRSLDRKVLQRTEQLSKANVVKGKLLSIVSHDLRGPLTSLYGLLGLVDRGQVGEKEAKRLFKGIRESMDASLVLLDNILLWASSQLKTNTVEASIEPLNVATLVDESIKPFAIQAARKKVTVKSEVPFDAYVMGDKDMLKSVVRNLVSNAIKFTQEGGCVCVFSKQEDKQLVVSVSDDGVGLSDEIKQTLFGNGMVKARFGTSEEKGAGIGLMLCDDLIRQMNGKIWVHPISDRGSTFCFSLPAAKEVPVDVFS